MRCSLLGLSSLLAAIALAFASSASAVAEGASFTASDFRSLYASVESRGIDAPMPWHAAAFLGVPVSDTSPCRQVNIAGQGGAARSIVSFQYQSHQYLVLLLRSGKDHWLFVINDAGKPNVALHAIVRDDWHTFIPSESEPLVAGEEAFWRNWIVDWPLP